MKTIVGKVVQIKIGVPVKKKDGGTYDGWTLTYEKEDGTIEQIAKATAQFKYQPSLKTSLEALSKDDDFTLEMEKNDKGFWDIVSIAKGANMPAPTPKKEYKTDKSGNYETPDERAKRQVLIVRQSSLSNAIEALGPGKKAAEYTKLAESFVDFVFEVFEKDKKQAAATPPEVE